MREKKDTQEWQDADETEYYLQGGKFIMNTFFKAAALFGKPYYEDDHDGDALWNTVLWAFGALGQKD